jgi:hypothetical protein
MTLTFDQIEEIYQAGVERGNDEATSYDWGCSPRNAYLDNLIDAISDIVNKDKEWDNRIRDEEIKTWIVKPKPQQSSIVDKEWFDKEFGGTNERRKD